MDVQKATPIRQVLMKKTVAQLNDLADFLMIGKKRLKADIVEAVATAMETDREFLSMRMSLGALKLCALGAKLPEPVIRAPMALDEESRSLIIEAADELAYYGLIDGKALEFTDAALAYGALYEEQDDEPFMVLQGAENLLVGIVNSYGALPYETLYSTARRFLPADREMFALLMSRYGLCHCVRRYEAANGELYVASEWVEKPQDLIDAVSKRTDIAYRVFDEENFIEACYQLYPLKPKMYDALVRILLKRAGYATREEAENVVDDIILDHNNDHFSDGTMPGFFSEVVWDGLEEAREVAGMIVELMNDTPLWINKGHKPNELSGKGPLEPGKVVPFETARRAAPKVGRNDLCPCGSGKKYKNCCGRG